MFFGSVCSGIEAASAAWHPLGWETSWLAEIEPFPSAVLAHHFPETTNHGDMTSLPVKVLSGEVEAPDVLVGGTPCQSFSIAGMREGLNDPRGLLTMKYVELLNAIDHVRATRNEAPAIAVWENVPGVLSDKDNAFGCFLAALAGEDSELQPAGKRWSNAGCVYGPQRAVAWRILDAQYFGVAQRRRRVFVVATARNGADPAQILFEWEGVRRDSAPSREAGPSITHDVAPSLVASGRGVERAGDTRGQDPVVAGYRLVAFGEYADDDTASTMKARDYKDHTDLVTVVHGAQDPIVGYERAHALGRNGGQENAVYPTNLQIATRHQALGERTGLGIGLDGDPAFTLQAAHSHGVGCGHAVRRLTPVECERLQGFPDNYTQIPWRDKPAGDCPDGHRYKALGNSMAVPCMAWIGKRIQNLIEEQ